MLNTEDLIRIRRFLHQNPEVGFELDKTTAFVTNELEKIGLTPVKCGRAGIIADIGEGDKAFLLRADMDALPIKEQSGLEFSAKGDMMHGCGHDMHTTMLLGAAMILKHHEKELKGKVRLMFQPGEEILQGAHDMIKAGALEGVDAAMMIHVMAGLNISTGTVLISDPGVGAGSADYFEIKVKGVAAHSAMPYNGADAVTSAAHIIIALQEIAARELSMNDKALITIGSMSGGTSVNSIPDTAVLNGIMRCFAEDTREKLKKRITEISKAVATAFRTEADVNFGSGCPTLINDEKLSNSMKRYMKELLGEDRAIAVSELDGNAAKASGAEDFAYISHKVPSIMVALAAGNPDEGYKFPQHHPEVRFDEKALPVGSEVYAYSAIRWLEENC